MAIELNKKKLFVTFAFGMLNILEYINVHTYITLHFGPVEKKKKEKNSLQELYLHPKLSLGLVPYRLFTE